MMSQLAPTDASGAYQRKPSEFRHFISTESSLFKPEPGRYVLYAALSCPWAHRTLIVYRMKGLESCIQLCIARPGDSGLWEFVAGGAGAGGESQSGRGPLLRPTQDVANGCLRLKDVYQLQPGGYDGRCTVPMLWDTKTKCGSRHPPCNFPEKFPGTLELYGAIAPLISFVLCLCIVLPVICLLQASCEQ